MNAKDQTEEYGACAHSSEKIRGERGAKKIGCGIRVHEKCEEDCKACAYRGGRII